MLSRATKLIILLHLISGPAVAQRNSPEVDEIARMIFELTNKERVARGLAPARANSAFDDLGRIQSRNMMQHDFFSHTDHKGRGPGERKDEFYPRLFGGVGENIAYVHGIPASQLARKFVKIWMDSPGHRANILRAKFSHLGVGVVRKGKTYYAAQVFGDLVAEMVSDTKQTYAFDTKQEFRFKFLGKFPRDKISIFLHFPDKSARFFTDENIYYTGVGYYQPQWLDDNHFTLKVMFDKGHGKYHLTMGSYETYTPGGLVFRVP